MTRILRIDACWVGALIAVVGLRPFGSKARPREGSAETSRRNVDRGASLHSVSRREDGAGATRRASVAAVGSAFVVGFTARANVRRQCCDLMQMNRPGAQRD
jgi:hypothetical protein